MEPEGSYLIHTCPPPVTILSQLDPLHTPTSHFLYIHLNISLQSTPGSPECSISLRVPHQNPVYASPLPFTRYMPRPPNSYQKMKKKWGGCDQCLRAKKKKKKMKMKNYIGFNTETNDISTMNNNNRISATLYSLGT